MSAKGNVDGTDSRTRSIRGRSPKISSEAWIAPTAVLTGGVEVAPGAVVMDGAVVTAESAPVTIGPNSIVMENAVVRGAGRHPTTIGSHTLLGPSTHVSGAVIGSECLIATHASVFNGSVLADGVLVAIGAIVHVGTVLGEGAAVPMQHIAVGDPVRIFPPDGASEVHRLVEQVGFTRTVFDHDTNDLTFRQSMAWLCATYSGALRRNGDDS
ncbi:gamma carbonic anhydrase family protein [Actinomadura terrae]|uniref:gamma carbonic anhydrase family protein n=1 Tax=Actinomadura terrae TaxID=604353 RepID=UPI001FA6BBEE|nr:acyltransferase [Actinomadura terrae]